MRILVTGSNGLLGQKLLSTLSMENHELHGVDLAGEAVTPRPNLTYHQHELTAKRPTLELMKQIQPEVIIHAAAMTAVDLCETERERCWNVNVRATETLAHVSAKIGARMLYISTDYVFDGENGPYSEDDLPNPVSYYGKSKLAGENVLRGESDHWTVIRTIVLYGCGSGIKSSFVTWLVGELRAGRQVRIVNDQWGNTTLAEDLSEGIAALLKAGKSGLYHMGGKDYLTRFDFAIQIARFFKLDESLISPITTAELKQPAKRPLRSGLIVEKAERELYCKFRNIQESLSVYKLCEDKASAI